MTIHAETNIYIALKAIAIVDAEGEYLSASYLQVRYQLANDNIEPWFTHFHEQART